MADTALAYGVSGVGKTTLAVYMAKWMYEAFGLTTRLISTDLGGWGPVDKEELIKAGIVEAFNVANRVHLLSDMRKLSRGEWPKPSVVVKEVDGVQRRVRVLTISEDKEALKKVGLYFVEGATSTSTAFLRHITKSSGAGRIGPEDVAGKYEEEGETFGGNSKGHFNIVQTEMHGLFAAFSALPVRLVLWTAHQGIGVIKRTGESCYAPQLAGGAKNAEVPSWIGDCFHLQDVPELLDAEGKISQQKQVRAYFISHADAETGVTYLCKSRVGPSDVNILKTRFPGGYVPLGIGDAGNLDQYFRWMEERKGANYSSIMKWKEQLDATRKSS